MTAATSIAITSTPTRHRRVEACMGTVFSIDVRTPGCPVLAVDGVFRWLHWVDLTFSTYKDDSEISRLGRDEIGLTDCAPEVREVLESCDALSQETHGYFSARPNGSLDPSGLVKGWAIQRASEMLTAAGSVNHCVNGGGDVHCAGSAAPGIPWRVGIADPFDRSRILAVIAGTSLAVATSGSAERGAHIVDPHDGSRPDALASVTLVGRDAGRTDALATAAFAMGRVAPEWIDSLPDHEGLVVFVDGTSWCSAGWPAADAYLHLSAMTDPASDPDNPTVDGPVVGDSFDPPAKDGGDHRKVGGRKEHEDVPPMPDPEGLAGAHDAGGENGSELGGFGHAGSIEPGAVEPDEGGA